ncbi:LLM class flavin-dependent oxidoreductase [Amycolatopsis sp. NPDC098790]|uniref:LLM class flavin-dependent oxidoreductase n=1 Tax=Amycolatopsis sp. NPDC098790 TaxID=3363939 RepID=UPI003824C023
MSIHALLIPNTGWPELLARARRLEDLGVEGVWVDDHVLNPAHPEQPWLDAWSLLPALAASTSRIRIGSLVANGLLRPPVVLARQALSVDQISNGRLELGLGAGYAAADRAAGNDIPFTDVLTIVDSVLRGEPVLEGFPSLAPARRIPLTIAAHGPRSLALAAKYGDRWVSYGGFGLSAHDHLAVTKKRIDVLKEADRPVRRMLLAGSPAVTAEPIWSSIGAVTDFVGRYREIGIDDFVFYYPPSPERVFEEFVTSGQ